MTMQGILASGSLSAAQDKEGPGGATLGAFSLLLGFSLFCVFSPPPQ